MVPLTYLNEGEFGKVVGLDARPGFRHRITSIGIVPGVVVKVVKKTGVGPLIIEVNGSVRIGIGWGQAAKIFVEPVK